MSFDYSLMTQWVHNIFDSCFERLRICHEDLLVLMGALEFSSGNGLSPSLVGPSQLSKQLRIVRDAESDRLVFPVRDIHKYYELEVETALMKERLYIILFVPVYSQTEVYDSYYVQLQRKSWTVR